MEESREERLTRLVETWQGMLLRICYVFLKDAEQARDATQETFLKAFRAMDQFRGESSEKTWLIRIAVNTCRSMQRSAWFRHTDRRVTPEELSLAQGVPVDDEKLDLMCAVMRLPAKLREVVTLYYWQDMTVEEIARTLEIAHSSVSLRLKRAREKLRSLLEGRSSDE